MAKPNIDWAAINRLLHEPSEDFDHLARLAGLDPASDFIAADLRGIDFGCADLSAYDFCRANVEGADFSRVACEPRNLVWARNRDRARMRDESEADQNWNGLNHPNAPFSFAPVPGLAEDAAPFRHETRNDLPAPPPGWTWVDRAWLNQYRQPLSDDDLIKFFDGRMPSWRVVLSERVPRRAVVTEAADLLRAGAAEPGRPTIVSLKGAGEGTSTACLQTIAQLLENDAGWYVLWRDNDLQPLPTDWVARLPDDGRPVLIATDAADNIRRSLRAFAEMNRQTGHNRFHFLLASRNASWMGSRGDGARLGELAVLQPLSLRDIKEIDAQRLYDAWAGVGEAGLGALAGVSREDAIRRIDATFRKWEVDHADGAFLAAMLKLRYGDGLKDQVRKKLGHLKARDARLFDAYAYIAAMHSKDLKFLSAQILAARLGCSEQELHQQVTGPLIDEACISIHHDLIFTRHRAIANVAIEILEEEGKNCWSLIVDLAENAIRLQSLGMLVPVSGIWRSPILNLLVNNEKFGQAIDFLERAHRIDRFDAFFLVNLSRLYRQFGREGIVEPIFRNALKSALTDDSFKQERRAFFYEWSLAAGHAEDHAQSVWLASLSLSDWQPLSSVGAEQVKQSLRGLCVACGVLFLARLDEMFLKAAGAAGQLGLRGRNLNPTARKDFERYRDDAKAVGVEDMSVEQAVQAIEVAVRRAFELCKDADDLVDLGVPYPPDEFGFSSLRDFMLAEQRRTRR